MASSSSPDRTYSELLKKAEGLVKAHPSLQEDLIEDLNIWKVATDRLVVSCIAIRFAF
jgi:hypothetical protein